MENQNQESSVEKLSIDVSQLPTLEVVEREYISLALKKSGGNKAKAAKLLGVSVKTIYNKLAQYAPTPTEP